MSEIEMHGVKLPESVLKKQTMAVSKSVFTALIFLSFLLTYVTLYFISNIACFKKNMILLKKGVLSLICFYILDIKIVHDMQ